MQRSRELHESLLEQKRRLVGAVRDRDEESVDNVLDIYRQLVERFLEQTSQYGIHFSPERARKEGASFASRTGWEPMDWIRDHYRSALEEAFREGYKPVLRSMLYFPMSLAIRGLEKRDYFIFQKFLVEPGAYPYQLSMRLEAESAQRLVVEKITGNFRDLVRFYIAPLVTDELTTENIAFVAEAGTGICLVFNSLMKEAIDQGNLKDFNEFNERLGSLWSGIEWRIDSHENWRMWNRVATEPHELEELVGEEHELHKKFEDAIDELRRKVRLIRFGLAAWVLRGFGGSANDVSSTRKWLEAIGPIGGLSVLLETYAYALDHQVQEKFGWSRWVMAEAPEGTVVRIDPEAGLPYAVIYYGSDLISEEHFENLLPDSLERARYLRQSVDEGALAGTLRDLSEEDEQWERLLQRSVDAVREEFATLTAHIVEAFEERWQDLVERSGLSDVKVQEFQNGVEEGYERSAGLKQVFASLGALELKGEDEESYRMERWIGFHNRLDKELFVPESPTRLRVLGENFGREMGRSEVRRLFTAILSDGTRRRDTTLDEIETGLDGAISDLHDEGFNNLVIFLTGVSASGIGLKLMRLGKLKQGDSNRFDSRVPYKGDFKGVPVFRSRSREHDGALIADIKSLGKWVQFKPWVNEEWSVIGNGLLKMSITQFNEEEAEEIVAEMEDGDGEEATVDDLLRDVRVRLFSRVEWEWSERRAAIWIKTSDEDHDT